MAISPGCVSGSPLKAHGGKPHGKSLCCPLSNKRVNHPVSLVGVISRMLSTCYLSLQAWVPTKLWQQNRNQVGVEVCSVIWWMYICQDPPWSNLCSFLPQLSTGLQSDTEFLCKAFGQCIQDQLTTLYCSNWFADPCANGVNEVLTWVYLPDINSVTFDLCKPQSSFTYNSWKTEEFYRSLILSSNGTVK